MCVFTKFHSQGVYIFPEFIILNNGWLLIFLISLKPAEAVRNMGVWFDADLTFSKHVLMICKACFGHVRDLRSHSNSYTQDALVTAANALVSSCLDYCNSLFRSLSSYNIPPGGVVGNMLTSHAVNPGSIPGRGDT